MLKLKGHGKWENEFRALADDNVRALSDRALREEEEVQDAFLGWLGVAKGPAATGVVVQGEGHRTLSWIWYATKTSTLSDAKLHEALQVEWCKAYSQCNCPREELVKVEEEMRQYIHFGQTARARWLNRAGTRTVMLNGKHLDAVVLEGARAYAMEQADRERRTCELLEEMWAPLRERAAAYLRATTFRVCLR
ncbi:hypothetical protein C8R43DRAFT_1122045 [Mycena crocata]|nr:hypothetical protein C8R43DRAFT_1122045 [Mycena crocata]